MHHENIFVILPTLTLALAGKCGLSTLFRTLKYNPFSPNCLVNRKIVFCSLNWRLSCYKPVKLGCLRSVLYFERLFFAKLHLFACVKFKV